MNAHQRGRGILAVQANGGNADIANMIRDLNNDWAGFKASTEQKDKDLEAMLDDVNVKLAALGMNGPSSPASPFVVADAEYSASFGNWFRNGRDEGSVADANKEGLRASIQASMSSGTSNAGGYLAPTEWDRRVLAALLPMSPMRRISTVITTTVGAFQTLWNDRGWASGWVGETAARPETATPTLEPVTFSAGEIYANPAITQRLLDDADYPVENWLASELATEFAQQESAAFIAGDGSNKPRGLLTFVTGGASEGNHPGGDLTVVATTGTANTLDEPDDLVGFVYGLSSAYRRNGTWLMNSTTAAVIAKLKDGQGNYIWRESYAKGQPATLLGYPVEFDENMPDIATGSLPIAFGDFKTGYVINDRFGVRILRDPYTHKPFVHFYATKRVGGGLRDPKAIRLLKIN